MITYAPLKVLYKASSISKSVALNGKVSEKHKTVKLFVEGHPAICYQSYR